jgi:iron(II)-dependent oxidoreductase
VVELPAFAIDRFPVTVRRYDEFVEAGGYDQPELWTSAGWQWRSSVEAGAPQGWTRRVGGGWLIRRFGHVLELDPREPVQHVSFHEAEAFARFAGGRLPTEAEWEKAASWGPGAAGPRLYPWGSEPPSPALANVGHHRWGPAPVGAFPGGASAYGVEQMLGDVYEWTSSPFRGYPGFTSYPYPEYSEVFFDDPEYRVLRGASWATSTDIARNTFRNWDYRIRRQIFSGIRLAWDQV